MPPLAALVAARRVPRAAWLLTVAFVWPITGVSIRVRGTLMDSQIRSIYFWGLLGLWLLLCGSVMTREPTSVPASQAAA